MQLLFDQIKQQKKQNLPFVLFRKPNSKTIILILQENDHVYFTSDFTEKGFVFATFENQNNIVFPLEFCKVSFGTFQEKEIKQPIFDNYKTVDSDKGAFITMVQKAIKNIQDNLIDKVVLSRNETIKIKNFKAKKTFSKILQSYPTAYCYYWYHPKVGTWMGASPEKLAKITADEISTTALAGTQLYKNLTTVVWQEKEKREQEIVTNFIAQKLNSCTSNLEISEPYSFKAGNLLHLKTDIKGILKPETKVKNIVGNLHPTPAVCGFPFDKAKEFILENENYDRTFYTGFFGELNYDFNTNETITDLYVNLRCMKITADTLTKKAKASIFVGCGITKESVPEKEWEETVNKSKTMKSIL